jgi:hypothetical protein
MYPYIAVPKLLDRAEAYIAVPKIIRRNVSLSAAMHASAPRCKLIRRKLLLHCGAEAY